MFNFISSIFKDEPKKVRRSVLASVEEAKEIMESITLYQPSDASLMREEDISRIAEFLPLIPDDVRVVTISCKEAGLLYRKYMGSIVGFFTVVKNRGVIIINLQPMVDYHGLILHELVHYEQWRRGDLEIIPGGVKWRGEVWSVENLSSANMGEEIANKPWETEAYARTSPKGEKAFMPSVAKKAMANWLKENL